MILTKLWKHNDIIDVTNLKFYNISEEQVFFPLNWGSFSWDKHLLPLPKNSPIVKLKQKFRLRESGAGEKSEFLKYVIVIHIKYVSYP